MGKRREGVDAALAVLEKVGIRAKVEHTRSAHLRISWTWNGKDPLRHRLKFAAMPSCRAQRARRCAPDTES
jgi:hypothetical protein